MREWKIERLSTFDDDVLAKKLTEIDNAPGQHVHSVIYMGDNSQHIRIYQIIYIID